MQNFQYTFKTNKAGRKITQNKIVRFALQRRAHKGMWATKACAGCIQVSL